VEEHCSKPSVQKAHKEPAYHPTLKQGPEYMERADYNMGSVLIGDILGYAEVDVWVCPLRPLQNWEIMEPLISDEV
jgi:hypothetical protein